jgi:hypothetical protein
MIHNFKTGRLGLSDPEIDREMAEIHAAMCARHNLDPNDCSSKTGTGHFYTPTEIHRKQVLWAMKMANSVLAYSGTKERWDQHHAWKFQSNQLWQHDGLGTVRKFGFNKVQNEAYALTALETDKVWEAQKARMAKATVLHHVHTGADNESYNAIKWG